MYTAGKTLFLKVTKQVRTDFYVYEHIKASNKQVFYVGKGCKKRSTSKQYRNQHWHNIVKKHGFEVKFVVKNVDEELAFLIEQERIDQLKRLGTKICNQTDGGEGSSGLVMPQSAKDTISKIHKGKTIPLEQRKKASDSLKKIKKSPDWIQKIADAKSKPVICIETGIEYKSVLFAQEQTGINKRSIRSVCNGWNKTAGGYKWRYK
jgi:hypothetical protein